MTIKENPIWRLFSSVRLALFIISLISVTSILGTIIPQGEPFTFYIERFGSKIAMIVEILSISNMYYSFWFKGLLILLCVNLIVCTYSRLPTVFKIIRQNNLDIDKVKHKLNKHSIILQSSVEKNAVIDSIGNSLGKTKKNFQSKEGMHSHLFFNETGRWSRLGAYVVHISILIIVLGAIVGNFLGYKAFVMLPEGKTIQTVYNQDSNKTIQLPFELLCQNFNVDYYENGTPREYKSDLVVIDGSERTVKQSITVNNPLKYKGVTFYQASYQPISGEYTVDISKKLTADSGTKTKFQGKIFSTPNRKELWEEGAVSFKIVASSKDGHGHGPYKIEFDDVDEKPINFIADDNSPFTLERNSASYSFTINQRYATGLQVAKDPGVWLVYLGSGLMLLGLYVAFFMSHQKLWVVVKNDNSTTIVHVYGSANKNQHLLNKTKETIVSMLETDESIELRRI